MAGQGKAVQDGAGGDMAEGVRARQGGKSEAWRTEGRRVTWLGKIFGSAFLPFNTSCVCVRNSSMAA